MVEVKNVRYKYKNGDIVLDNINLEVDKGQVVGIIGKNGSGKSTLAKLISGITIPSEGEILINGIDTSDKDKFIEFRKNVRNSFSKSRKPNNI